MRSVTKLRTATLPPLKKHPRALLIAAALGCLSLVVLSTLGLSSLLFDSVMRLP